MEIPSKVYNHLFSVAKNAELIGCSRHAAVLTYKKRIVCTGTAKARSHPFVKKFSGNDKKIYLHAEIDCIIKALSWYDREFIEKCKMYVLRISRGGFVGMSKPCPVCQGAINSLNLKDVKWTE